MTRAGSLALGGVVALLGGCREAPFATEIVVTVDTTFGVPCTIDTLRVTVVGDGEPVVREVPVTGADLPGSLTLVPDGDVDGATITVAGLRAGEVFATAEAMVPFDREDSIEVRFVLDRSCVGGAPCPAVGIGGFEALPPPVSRRGCGEAGYEVADSLVHVRDACSLAVATTGAVLADVQEEEMTIPFALPFPFSFYGERIPQLWVGTNGYAAFSAEAPDAFTNRLGVPRSLGDVGSFPTPAVLPFWDTLRTGPSGVCFAVTGELPDRILWITWKEACFQVAMNECGDSAQGTLTFSVGLEETTDRIYVGYIEMTGTGSAADRARAQTAVIGVTAGGTPGCLADACSDTGECDGGGACNYTERWAGGILDPLPDLEFRPR